MEGWGRAGWDGVEWSGVEWEVEEHPVKTCTPLEQPVIHTMTYVTLIGHRDIQSAVGAILSTHHLATHL